MKTIVKQGKNLASKAGAGLGFNTHAGRVAETKKIANSLKHTHSPKEAAASAKKNVVRQVSTDKGTETQSGENK